MKQRELKRRIAAAASGRELVWTKVREGKQHEVWKCGAAMVTIPRHREINEYTATGIFKHLECELGGEWWRK
ncbi:MAG: hypothetical protein ACYDAY_08115 [Candidatus Dormibacteria bacterium]